MAPFKSLPVDTAPVTQYFSSLPVRTCESEGLPTIQRALKSTIYSCTAHGTKEQRKAEYRHTNPAGNLFALAFSLCEADRFGYAVQFIEFLCIVDDIMEALPFKEACLEHAILREALSDGYQLEGQDSGPVTGRLSKFLFSIRMELVTSNDSSSLVLLQTLDTSLHNRDSVDSEFLKLEDYIPYRKMNFDYDFVCQLVRWAMRIPLKFSPEKEILASQYEHSIGVIVGLTNDYFSWEMERNQDRICNAVLVLMTEHSIPDHEAKQILQDIILNEEKKVKELKDKLENGAEDDFAELKLYLKALELFASGYSFWCSTCPRYHQIEKD